MFVSKTSWRHLQNMSSRRPEDVFSVTIFRLSRGLQDVLEDDKLLRWRRIEGVFKTCLEGALKTSWRPANVCWVNAVWNSVQSIFLFWKLYIVFDSDLQHSLKDSARRRRVTCKPSEIRNMKQDSHVSNVIAQMEKFC